MKIGRNDPCPCGSGKKYKKRHLARDAAEARTAEPRVVERGGETFLVDGDASNESLDLAARHFAEKAAGRVLRSRCANSPSRC